MYFFIYNHTQLISFPQFRTQRKSIRPPQHGKTGMCESFLLCLLIMARINFKGDKEQPSLKTKILNLENNNFKSSFFLSKEDPAGLFCNFHPQINRNISLCYPLLTFTKRLLDALFSLVSLSLWRCPLAVSSSVLRNPNYTCRHYI